MSLVPHKRRRKSTKTASDMTSFRRQSQDQHPNSPEDTAMNLNPDNPVTTTSAPADNLPTTPAPQPTPLAQSPPQIPPFLLLPLEIRRQIYAKLVFAPPSYPLLWPSPPCPPEKPRTLHPAILRTNRQINAEATGLLYTHNRFSFHHPSDCNIFSHIFAQPFAHYLTSIVFRLRDRPADIALWSRYFKSREGVRGLRADMPGLVQVLIFVGQNWPGGGNLEPREAYDKWLRSYALRELRDSLDMIARGRTCSHNDDIGIHQDEDEPSSPGEENVPTSAATSTKEVTPVDSCVVSSIRVSERVWESLVAGLAGEGGVLTECPRGVLRGTIVPTAEEPVRLCLEVVSVARERERA